MNIISDGDILKYINSVSSERGIHLSPTVRAFYISLVHMAIKEAHYDEECKLSYVQYSQQEFSNLLQFSYHMVVISLQKLNKCGLIKRVSVQREFCRLSGGEYTVNKGNITFIDLTLFEK